MKKQSENGRFPQHIDQEMIIHHKLITPQSTILTINSKVKSYLNIYRGHIKLSRNQR